jgi:ribonuclease HIII
MPALTTYTKNLTAAQAETLRTVLASSGFEFSEKPYCLYAASKGKLNIHLYQSGPKVVIQGKETEDFITMTLEPLVLGQAELGYEEVLHPEMFSTHIGVDESGKGDFFGPLVIAGAWVDADVARHLRAEGIMDSKRIGTDARIAALARVITSTPGIAYDVICITPEKYNDLYKKFGNLNRLLAWGHATVIENLLTKRPDCPRAISDQFADPAVLQRALKEKGRGIELVQRTKAESDPAVAAASILARHRFVSWLADTSESVGTQLLKGVSAQVKDAARKLVSEKGADFLSKVSKVHFRTHAEVVS